MNENEIFSFLKKYDTPTVCNALEVAMGKRQNTGFTQGTPVFIDKNLPPFVGYAITAKIQGYNPAKNPEKAKELRWKYYQYVANSKKPAVMVIQDVDYPRAIGAYWGEVNVAIHKNLKIAGVLTNGILRDLGSLDKGFQVIAGSIGPSHANVHITEIDCPVEVFSLQICPNDIIHADIHGAVIIPKKYLKIMLSCIEAIFTKEKPLLEAARKNNFSLEILEKKWKEFTEFKANIKN